MSWFQNNGLNYKVPHQQLFEPVLRIRTGFNEDPDHVLYLYADPDLGSQSPKPMRIFAIKKLDFDMKNVHYFMKIICYKTYTHLGAKAFLDGFKSGLLVNFPCSWIRIRIPNTDPDKGETNQCETLLCFELG
jgi:hypothetical protein